MSPTPHRPLLFVPIEIKVREFHGKLLFAALAAERGYDVVLGGQAELLARLPEFRRGVYLDKSVAATKVKWFEQYRRLGHRVAAWDEEGLIYLGDEMYRKNRLSDGALDQVERFFAWGRVQAGAIEKYRADLAPKLCRTGNPRFDLLRPELRAFYAAPAAELRQRFGRFLLINTNFGHYNHYLGTANARKLLDHYPIGRERDFLDGWFEFQRVAFTRFKELLPVLEHAFPEHTLIVRPSPSENRDAWIQEAAARSRVKVEWAGNVLEWIVAADAVVHFNCTTGLEAFLLDVPALAYRCVQNAAYEPYLPNAVSTPAANADEVVARLREALAPGAALDPAERARRMDCARPYIESLDGALAGERILDALRDIEFPSGPALPPEPERTPLAKRIWRAVLKVVRREDPQGVGYMRQKFPGLEQAEVDLALRRLREASGRFGAVRARPAGESCFVIGTDADRV